VNHPNGRGRVSVPARAHEAFRLWKEGVPIREIAARENVTYDAALRWVRAVRESKRQEIK
jgi:transposase-like protein